MVQERRAGHGDSCSFELVNECFELGVDVTDLVVGGCLGKGAVGFSMQVLLQSSAE
jgi:hypothetical protein